MSKISKAFDHGKAFIPFITCGDPDLETTKEIVLKMVEAGADLIELGIPFSDPTAEGPVIMDADLGHLPPSMPLISGALADVNLDGQNLSIDMKLA